MSTHATIRTHQVPEAGPEQVGPDGLIRTHRDGTIWEAGADVLSSAG